ncbi:hypothetical protein HPB50_008959 [Hyalomma asiaticum]|uniref:Uncharacterized protein n=1 Tax=Hyalomma asiaticum TaxID=266040 RepID=A0ACB7T6U8_HYAAI|nr:hypothetical protein HPB50_008959 [Hyalomma asiaticum]
MASHSDRRCVCELSTGIVPAQCSSGVPPGVKRHPRCRFEPLQVKSKLGQRQNCSYIGALGNRGNRQELERAFGFYGPLKRVWVARSPAGFAFDDFNDPQDAWDGVCALHGEAHYGRRAHV